MFVIWESLTGVLFFINLYQVVCAGMKCRLACEEKFTNLLEILSWLTMYRKQTISV